MNIRMKQQAKSINLPLFFPAKEVLSIYPGFIASYEDRELAFDETYYDLCKALSRFPLRGKRREEIADWVAPLAPFIPGKLILEFNRFYLQLSEHEKREISLVAEGIRKIAMLNYLILNASLKKGGTLFLIEIKDFRGARIENKQRIEHAYLADEVAQKVRDTIAGLYGAYRCCSLTLAPFYKYLFANPKYLKEKRESRKITAILFLEEDKY